MIRACTLTSGVLVALLISAPVAAQDPPPRIGPYVIDLHATIPRFPGDDGQLAESRGVATNELPGAGLGLHGGVHFYPFSWKAVTFGIGVDATVARAHRGARQLSDLATSRPTTETLLHAAPELSFNFGDGDGWSYLSGGIGPSVWSLTIDGTARTDADIERLQTINYGGGGRWFIKPHLAFSLDVRFYAIYPGTANVALARPGGPRSTLLFIGAGVSTK